MFACGLAVLCVPLGVSDGCRQLCTQPFRAAVSFCLLEQTSGSRENELCEDFYCPIMCAQGARVMG